VLAVAGLAYAAGRRDKSRLSNRRTQFVYYELMQLTEEQEAIRAKAKMIRRPFFHWGFYPGFVLPLCGIGLLIWSRDYRDGIFPFCLGLLWLAGCCWGSWKDRRGKIPKCR
jgi:hypothetical protein